MNKEELKKFILQEIRSLRENVTMQPWMRDSDLSLQFNNVWVPGHSVGSDRQREQVYVNRLGYTPQDVSELPEEEYEKVEARLKSIDLSQDPAWKKKRHNRRKKSKQSADTDELAALADVLKAAAKEAEESGEEVVDIEFADI